MPGTKEGGLKARQTNMSKDPDFYKKIGAIGGKKGSKDGVIKGWAAMDKQKHRKASILGGKISRRGKAIDKKL